uniref:Uncharacterized protein n=1 Tax=Timema cristinae TaxID=61476 RepID=A0A7R9H6U8_TIMCR|nr:unnamed protein product [Timema cristinae]
MNSIVLSSSVRPNVNDENSIPAFAWKGSGKPDRESNLDLPVIGSPVYCDSSALDHAATERDDDMIAAPLNL